MKTNEIINELVRIGLTASEARAYYHLLKKRSFTASEIAQLAQVPQSKIYGILGKLAQKGLCTEILGKVKKYSSVNPQIGFNNLCNKLEEKKKQINTLSEILLPLYLSEKENDDPSCYMEVIHNLDQIGRRYLELVENSEIEIFGFMKPPYVIPPKKLISIRECKKKGRKEYGIYEVRDSMTQEERDEFLLVISNLSREEEIRIVKEAPVKMVVFDRRITMFSLDDPVSLKPTLTTMVITHQSFALFMQHIFMNIWKQAIPYHEFIKDKDWCLNK